MLTATNGSQTQLEAATFGLLVLMFLMFVGGLIIPKAGYDLATQGRISLSTLFTDFNYLTAVGLVVVVQTCVGVASQLAVIPGLIVGGCLMFAHCSGFHRRMGVGAALKESYQLASGNLLKSCGAYLGLNLVAVVSVGASFLFFLFVLLPWLQSGLGLLVALAIPCLVALCVAVSVGCAAAQACLYLNAIRERDALNA